MSSEPYTIDFYPELDRCDIRWTGPFTPEAASRYTDNAAASYRWLLADAPHIAAY